MTDLAVYRVCLRIAGDALLRHRQDGLPDQIRTALATVDLPAADPDTELLVHRLRLDLGRFDVGDASEFRSRLAAATRKALNAALTQGTDATHHDIGTPTQRADTARFGVHKLTPAASSRDRVTLWLSYGVRASDHGESDVRTIRHSVLEPDDLLQDAIAARAVVNRVWRQRSLLALDVAIAGAKDMSGAETGAPASRNTSSSRTGPSGAGRIAGQLNAPRVRSASDSGGSKEASLATPPEFSLGPPTHANATPPPDREADPARLQSGLNRPYQTVILRAILRVADALDTRGSSLRQIATLPKRVSTASVTNALGRWHHSSQPVGAPSQADMVVHVLADAVLEALNTSAVTASDLRAALGSPPLSTGFDALVRMAISPSSTSSTTAGESSEARSIPSAGNAPEDIGALSNDHPIAAPDAGVILLWPFIERYLAQLDLDPSVRPRNAAQAALAIRRLAGAMIPEFEADMVMSRLLAGLPLEEPLPLDGDEFPGEPEQRTDLLSAVIGHWGALGTTSPGSFQEAFLMRPGIVTRHESHWQVKVEKAPYDLLFARLPWPMSVVRLKWMEHPIHVEWP